MYDPGELVEKVTGTSLTPEPFVQYLTKKYTSLWE
jgi:Zn-dependent M32 family carboxypeptidase